jgi:hypothetical protein
MNWSIYAWATKENILTLSSGAKMCLMRDTKQ